MTAQDMIEAARLTRVRELQTQLMRAAAENTRLANENAELKAHLDLALVAAEDLRQLPTGGRLVIMDGWNLILGAKRQASGKRELVAQARAHLAENPLDRVWIVFDGPHENVKNEDRLRISYTGGVGIHRADRFICDFLRMARFVDSAERVVVATRDKDFRRDAGRMDAQVMDEKDKIRARMRLRRRNVSAELRATISATICEKLLAREDVRAAIRARSPIAVYLASAQEIDLRIFITSIIAQGGVLAAPRWNGADYEMAELSADAAQWVKGPNAILQPPADARRVPPIDVAVWIVPGLAFTRKGHRLGYGGGWYDRLLASPATGVPILGVGYDFQILRYLPCEVHDRRLTDVVTEVEK